MVTIIHDADVSLTVRHLSAKKQRVVDCAKILLDIAKESADWFPPLKAALGGVSSLVKHYEVLVHSKAAGATDTNACRSLKMSEKGSRNLYPSWIGSSKTSPPQQLTKTLRRQIDARG